ncbi:carbonic anhydrase [Vibrio profundi]|uniref:carbonic anhydrase n=1 Tax=Vibrio profundi TaxID=1774960 RepID=UPI00373677A8
MKNIVSTILTISALSTPLISHASEWGYTGDSGPEHWKGLCQSGVNQSPIDISNTIEGELDPIQFNYGSSGQYVLNNGHTIQVNIDGSHTIDLEGKTFSLLQFHFHTPSENLIKGHAYPLEMHLVHADENNNLAVVGVMLEEGAESDAIEKVWSVMPQSTGKARLPQSIELNDLLPKDQDYYRFNGSLTTPPCSEGVTWLVMKSPISISSEQLTQFKTIYSGNSRPVQRINARPVLN